jgi:hypothetical protein
MRHLARSTLMTAFALVFGVALAPERQADACGGGMPSYPTRWWAADHPAPPVVVEQVLIVHDASRELEHFIREIRFQRATSSFGFVVPVPSIPEVSAIAGMPFESLPRRFAFRGEDELDYVREVRDVERRFRRVYGPLERETPSSDDRKEGGTGTRAKGEEGSMGRPAGVVNVLSRQRVGSFTAFVLDATDGAAMQAWLDENGFRVEEGMTPWLDYYARLSFTYVAFRYDHPPAGQADGMVSETVRLTFATPQPFYPYREPVLDHEPVSSRLLAVWLATSEAMTPVACRRDRAGALAWEVPWQRGVIEKTNQRAPSIERTDLPDAFQPYLPSGALSLQAFQDQRVEREGLGDVVFVPERKRPLSPADVAKREKLLPLLDPALEPREARR